MKNKKHLGRVNNKMKDAINSDLKFSEKCRVLHKIFVTEEEIDIKHALACKTLFLMFLDHSGNKLLMKLIEGGHKMGRNGKTAGVEAFQNIW